jgi:hypothetical protein
VANPLKTIELTWNKSIYFWSPWSGPIAEGTMARNPWLKINPIVDISKSSQDGNRLVYGIFGQMISWAWLLGGIFLMIYGFVALVRKSNFERQVGILLLLIVLSSWFAAVATIGDHRFRIPTMSMSLVLQFIGLMSLKEKITKN